VRMFVYYYRLFDTLGHAEIISLAILADSDPNWRPELFQRALAGCELSFRFRVVKLIDFEESALEAHSNPFALVVLAHLRALKVRGNPQLMFAEKVRLIRMLAQRGYNPDDVANLYRVVDYLMALPKELEEQVEEIVREVARERRLTKLTNLERFALERGARQGLQEGLQQGTRRTILSVLRARFGKVPRRVQRGLQQVQSLEQLELLSTVAVKAADITAFEQALQEMLQSQ